MMPGPRPCGMCSRICWRCQDRYERAKAEREQQEARLATLELAFAEASDDERDAIAEQLQEATEVWWELGEELDDMEEGNA